MEAFSQGQRVPRHLLILGIHRHLFRHLWKPQIQSCWKAYGHSKCSVSEAQNHTALKDLSLKSWRQQWWILPVDICPCFRGTAFAGKLYGHPKHSRAAEPAGIFDTHLLSCGDVNRCINSSWSPRNKTAGETEKHWETLQSLEVKASPDRRALLPGVFIRVHPLLSQQHGSPPALCHAEKTEVQQKKGWCKCPVYMSHYSNSKPKRGGVYRNWKIVRSNLTHFAVVNLGFFPHFLCVSVSVFFSWNATHNPVGPSHTFKLNPSAKLRQCHTVTLRTLNIWQPFEEKI